jgi:hypothetical protein
MALMGATLSTASLQVTSLATPVNAVFAESILTIAGENPQIVATNTVTIDGKVYTFVAALTSTEGEVLVGASDTLSLSYLYHAINHDAGFETEYYCALAHPTVEAYASDATTMTIRARVGGSAANAILLSANNISLSWGGAALGGAVSGVNATIGALGDLLIDSNYGYVVISTQGVSDSNWRKFELHLLSWSPPS